MTSGRQALPAAAASQQRQALLWVCHAASLGPAAGPWYPLIWTIPSGFADDVVRLTPHMCATLAAECVCRWKSLASRSLSLLGHPAPLQQTYA